MKKFILSIAILSLSFVIMNAQTRTSTDTLRVQIIKAKKNSKIVMKDKIEFADATQQSTAFTTTLATKVAVLVTGGNGTSFLSNNGAYRAIAYSDIANKPDSFNTFTGINIGSPIVEAAAKGDYSYQAANTKWVQRNNKFLNRLLQFGFDANCKALPLFATESGGASNETLVSNTVRSSVFTLDDTTTVTGVKINVTTAGVFIAKSATGLNGVIIYSYSTSTGNWTKITASQGTDTTLWKSAGIRTIAFGAAQTLNPGIYAVFWSYSSASQTTAPVVPAFNLVNYGQAMTNLFPYQFQPESKIASQTSFGSPLAASALSGTGYVPVMWLY
jgi:hypothetical protein